MKRWIKGVFLLVVLAFALSFLPQIWQQAEQWRYPRRFASQVELWAQEYDLDPLLVYAFIRTESGFDPQAESSVGARGLMQMTEETFLWLKTKLPDTENLTFDSLYEPSCSIRFGAYYLHLCLVRYEGDVETAAAAYHSGWGTVDALLAQEKFSADGRTLDEFPYAQMNHYVEKILRSYERYTRLYSLVEIETTE